MTSMHARITSLNFQGPPLDPILYDIQNRPEPQFVDQHSVEPLSQEAISIVEDYAGFGSITRKDCPDLFELIQRISKLSKEHLVSLHENLCQLDAIDLYDALRSCRHYYQRILEDAQLREGLGFCYTRLDMALSKKCYKAIIRSLLYSFVDENKEKELAYQARDKIMRAAITRGRSKIPIEVRLRYAAEYQFTPKGSSSSYHVLPTIPYADVAALEISFVSSQALKDLALKVWSITFMSGFDRKASFLGYKQRYNTEIITIMGVQTKKNYSRRITDRQKAISRVIDPGEFNSVSTLARQESHVLGELYKNPEAFLKTKIQKDALEKLVGMPDLINLPRPLLAIIAAYAYMEEDEQRVQFFHSQKGPGKSSQKSPADWTLQERLRAVSACLSSGAYVHSSMLFRCDALEIAQELLEFLPDKNERDPHGNTALHDAAAHNRIQIVDLLLLSGGDPNAVNFDGNTPLHLSISHFTEFEIAQRLLDVKALVSLPNSYTQSPYDNAIRLNSYYSRRRDEPFEKTKKGIALKQLIQRMERMKAEEMKLLTSTQSTPRLWPLSARRLSHSSSPSTPLQPPITPQQTATQGPFNALLSRPYSASVCSKASDSQVLQYPSSGQYASSGLSSKLNSSPSFSYSQLPHSRVSQSHQQKTSPPHQASDQLQQDDMHHLTPLPAGVASQQPGLRRAVIQIHPKPDTPQPEIHSQPEINATEQQNQVTITIVTVPKSQDQQQSQLAAVRQAIAAPDAAVPALQQPRKNLCQRICDKVTQLFQRYCPYCCCCCCCCCTTNKRKIHPIVEEA